MTYPTSAGKLPGTVDVLTECKCGLRRDVTVSEASLRMLALGESPAIALADLLPTDRELVISGACGLCWRALRARLAEWELELEAA
jgi:hypothetical protein